MSDPVTADKANKAKNDLKAKATALKKQTKETIKRQQEIEKQEICHDFNFVFGEVVPKKRKEVMKRIEFCKPISK